MIKVLKNDSGFTLIVILLVVVIIAAIFYFGGDFIFSGKSNTEKTLETYEEAQVDLNEINKLNKQHIQETNSQMADEEISSSTK